jgi:hypothetical protein
MQVPFKIKVTKAILEQSKECGTCPHIRTIEENCAIAISLKHIFPAVMVTGDHILPFGKDVNDESGSLKIELPKVARDFINAFDSLSGMPNVRPLLPEMEFEILIPDEIVSRINIDEIMDVVGKKKEVPDSIEAENA